MTFNCFKYKSIEEFIERTPKSSRNNYTIIHKCKGLNISDTTSDFTNYCFGCLFCVVNHPELVKKITCHFSNDFIGDKAEESFCGNLVSVIPAKNLLKAPYKSLEYFTKVDETTNIQPWAAKILNCICSGENQIGMEVPVFNDAYSRNGRLDICSLYDEKLIVVETKTSLDDALGDERFVEQHQKYTDEIGKYSSSYIYLTMIGGREGDLYPVSSQYCTGQIGAKTERFYSLITNNNIKFISANALWCLCSKYLKYGSIYAWDKFLFDIFNEEGVIGLVSAGKIKLINGEFEVTPV